MAEGLNGTLSNRLAKKKVEMLGYATSSIKSRALLDTRIVITHLPWCWPRRWSTNCLTV